MRIATRWLLVGVVGVALLLAIVGIWFYRAQEKGLRQRVEAELSGIARLKAAQIADWRAQLASEAQELADLVALEPGGVATLSDAGSEVRERWRAALDVLRRRQSVDEAWLADPSGALVLGGARPAGGEHPELAALVAAVVADGEPRISDLVACAASPRPHLVALAPIAAGGAGRLAGVALLIESADDFLYPLVQSWPTPSATAETLLVRRDGEDVLYLNGLRGAPEAALRLRVPLSRSDRLATEAVRGERGVIRGLDYRGVDVLAALETVPGTRWLMIAKVDADEALDEWSERARLLLGLASGLLLAVGLAGAFVWQWGRKEHYRELYRAEASRSAEAERTSATLRSIGEGVVVTDAQGRVERINEVAERLLGLSQGEALRRELGEVLSLVEGSGEAFAGDAWAASLSRGEAPERGAGEVELLAADGRRIPVAGVGTAVIGADGVATGQVLVLHDQTEERRARRVLQRSEALFRSALFGSPIGMALVSLEGCIVEANPALAEIVGREREALLGAEVATLLHPDERGELLAADGRIPESRDGYAGETRLERVDQSEVWTQLTVSLVPAREGLDGYFVVQAQDISPRKRAEAERERLQAQLLRAQKLESVGRLAGGVAHDFNNMLSVILGRTSLALGSAGISADLRAQLVEIQGAGEKSAELTRQLLAFARRQTIAPRVVDLNELVESVLKLLRRLIGEDIDLAWLPGTGLWPTEIDPAQLDQVLTNLCVNARDAIAGVGRVTIETGNTEIDESYCEGHPEAAAGHYVYLAVTDDGAGIEKEHLDRIFEPFFTTKPAGEGTGLGLSMVYGIARQNGGFVNAYSEPGRGSTFRVYFPRTAKALAARVAPSDVAVPHGSGETVLLVEDEPAVLRLTAAMLRDLGYAVQTAPTPGEAIRIVEELSGPLDLVFTDVVMPEMSGRDLALRLRAARPGLRCLFMSGYTSNAVAHQGILDQGVSFLQKPFSMRDLARALRSALAAPPWRGDAGAA